MTFKTIIGCILLFFVFRFLYRFLVPIIRVTRATQKSMSDLRNQMQNMQNAQGFAQNQQQQAQAQPQAKKATPQIDGEYIEFEEVK